jgi:hypothetical protein
VKVISLEEAKGRLPAIFEEALSGEIIRFRSPKGDELELTPVQHPPKRVEFPMEDLARAYEDAEWARFENNCGKASD